MPLTDWITVRDAAEQILGVTPQRVHQLIATYGVEIDRKSPRLTLVKRKDIERVAEMERPSGLHQDRSPQRRRRA